MTEKSSAENSARGILKVFADNKVGVDQVYMLDWLKTLFSRSTQLGAPEFEEGVDYAIKQGWVSEHVSQIRLEQAGFDQFASLAA